MNTTGQTYQIWTGISMLVAAMLLVWGYTFGHENSIQLMPMVLHAHDSSLYAQDYYVQHAAERFLNERSFFLMLLYPFGTHLEIPCFIIFLVATFLLFRALVGIGMQITGSLPLTFAGLLVLVFPFNFHALGMNEVFGRELSATLLSDTAAAWAVWMFLRNKIWPAYLLIIISTLMHPLAGLQMFLLVSGVLVVQGLVQKHLTATIQQYWKPVALFACTGLLYIIVLQMGLKDAEWDDAIFFQSFFVFRNAHHYIPTYYPQNDWMLLGTLYIITPFLLFRKQKQLFYFSLLIITGCIIYSFGVLQMHSVTIATAQWFKSTMWLEVIAIFAVLHITTEIAHKIGVPKTPVIISTLALIYCVFWLLMVFPTYSFWKSNTAYEFPFYTRITPEIDIAQQIKAKTNKDALLIQPTGLDELKYYSQRSGYVDYKALTHTKGFIKEWSARFKEVYGVDPATSPVVSFPAMRVADEHFRSLTPEALNALHQQHGITHIVTFADVQLPYTVIAQNTTYIVYQL